MEFKFSILHFNKTLIDVFSLVVCNADLRGLNFLESYSLKFSNLGFEKQKFLFFFLPLSKRGSFKLKECFTLITLIYIWGSSFFTWFMSLEMLRIVFDSCKITINWIVKWLHKTQFIKCKHLLNISRLVWNSKLARHFNL